MIKHEAGAEWIYVPWAKSYSFVLFCYFSDCLF